MVSRVRLDYGLPEYFGSSTGTGQRGGGASKPVPAHAATAAAKGRSVDDVRWSRLMAGPRRHMRLLLPASVVLTIALGAAPISSAFAQAPSCIPSGEGAAPYTGDWTRIPRAERIALCKEGERREQARQQESEQARQQERQQEGKEAAAARRAAQKVTEQTAVEPQAPPERGRMDGPGPILRGTDASGLPILTDDPNILRR